MTDEMQPGLTEDIGTDAEIPEPPHIDEEDEATDASEADKEPIETDAQSETELLRNEVERLKAQLEERQAAEAKNMKELQDFMRLYPDTPLQSVPREVWQRVEEGLPLSAAYALHEKELALIAYRAKEINDLNASRAAGKAGVNEENEYFSYDEVRSMTQREVHDNYEKIRRSMKHWRNATH